MKRRILPDIREGTRIQFVNPKNSGTYCGVVARRNGNTLTIKRAAGIKQRIRVENVIGYWPSRVKASSGNMVKVTRG